MAIDDPPDDMSDHPDHPENHNFILAEWDTEPATDYSMCYRCGIMKKDHPVMHLWELDEN